MQTLRYGFSQTTNTAFTGSVDYLCEWLGGVSRPTVINTLDNLVKQGLLTKSTCKDEIHFIIEHYNSYKQMPDKLTFLGRFKDFQMLEVTESTDYLVYKLKEAYTYTKLVPLIEDTAKVVKEDGVR